MRKVFFVPLLLLLSLLVFDTNVLADSNLSSEEINRLYNLGFDDRDIEQMSDEELEYNLQFDGELVAKNVKYLKVVENNGSSLSLNKLASVYSTSTTVPLGDNAETIIELSKEQFEKEVAAAQAKKEQNVVLDGGGSIFDGGVSINAVNPAVHTTSYKTFQTSITKYSTSRFRVMSKVSWVVAPENRKLDIIATSVNTANWTIDASTQYGKMWYYSTYNCGKSSKTGETVYSSSNKSWTTLPGVYPLKIDLPNSDYNGGLCFNEVVETIDAYAYYEVIKANTSAANVFDAYGYYGHQESSVQISPSFSVGGGGVTIGFSVTPSTVFTNTTTHAQVTW